MRRFFVVFLALLMAAGWGQSAAAQSVGPKQLCEGLPAASCDTFSGSPTIGEPVYYEFDLIGGPTTTALEITEDYSPHFVPLNSASPVQCTVKNGANAGNQLAITVVSAGPPFRFTVQLQGGEDAVCRMAGTFITPGQTAPNNVSVLGQPNVQTVNTVISTSAKLDADLEIRKTRILPTAAPLNISGTPGIARYRIEVETDRAVYLGEFFRIFDQLALFPNATAITTNLQPGSTCQIETAGGSTSAIAGCGLIASFGGEINTPGWKDFASWGLSPGALVLLEQGDKIIIEYDVEYSVPPELFCVTAPDSEGMRNRAFLGLAGSSSALQDRSNGNNDTVSDTASDLELLTGSYNVDPDCNTPAVPGPTVPPTPLTISKTINSSPDGGMQWGNIVQYNILVKNSSADVTAYDIELRDIVGNLAGTPNFTAELVNTSLNCAVSGTVCTQTDPPTANTSALGSAFGPGGPIVAFTSYYDQKEMWKATINQLAPGRQVGFQVRIRYNKPTCDFAPLIENKLIRNTIVISHKIDWPVNDPNSGSTILTGSYSQSDSVDLKMVNPPACAITVKKTSKPGKNVGGTPLWNDGMIFDGWKEYELVFSSLPPTPTHNQTIEIGTLIDAVRIENAFYATGMQLEYEWACADLSGGGVRGFQTSGNGTAAVNHVGQPHQGVRIMDHPGVVEFDPGSSLKCDVRITVQRPDKSDPYCFSDGQPYLQNLALMDGSRFFNANMPWPHAPKGMSWDATSDKLPNCFHLVMNKVPSPSVVAPGGGPVEYIVTITNATIPGTNGDVNFPDSAAGSRVSPSFTDMFIAPDPQTTIPPMALGLTFSGNPCLSGTTIRCNLFAHPAQDAYIGEILRLPSQQSMTIRYRLDGPFNPHQFCNRVRGFAGDGRPFYETYFKDYDTWETTACVLVRGSLEVEKSFILPPWVTMDPATEYSIGVGCNAPKGFDDFGRVVTVSPGSPNALIDRIVIGSECEIEELDLPDADTWGECQWKNPLYPAGREITIDGSADPHKLTVVNELECAPPPTRLDITKELVSDPNCIDSLLCTFRITVKNIGGGFHSGPVTIEDAFSNGPEQVFYSVDQITPYQWDWQCNQPSANKPIQCTESDLVLGPGEESYFDMLLDLGPAGTNCAYLEVPQQTPKPESCVDVGPIFVDTTGLQIEKFKITPGSCEGGGSFGQNCTFEFVITNTGSVDFSGPLTITDTVSVPSGPNSGVTTVISNTPGWNCTAALNVVTCTMNPASILAGGSITVSLELNISYAIPPAGNCATLGNVSDDGQTLESCVDFSSQGGRGDHAFKITKEVVSDARMCSYSGNFRCEYRITLEYTGTATFSGTLQVTDIFSDSSGAALSKVLIGQPTNGWSCPTTSANPLHDCYKAVGPLNPGDTDSFNITFDHSGTGPFSFTNCARLEAPILSPRPQSCVPLGQHLFAEPEERRAGDEDDEKKDRKRKRPRIKINIGIGGLFGGGRKKDREDEPEPQRGGDKEPGVD